MKALSSEGPARHPDAKPSVSEKTTISASSESVYSCNEEADHQGQTERPAIASP
jgi:hypothetical protein